MSQLKAIIRGFHSYCVRVCHLILFRLSTDGIQATTLGAIFFLSLLISMLLSSRNTFKNRPRIMFDQISGNPVFQSSCHLKLTTMRSSYPLRETLQTVLRFVLFLSLSLGYFNSHIIGSLSSITSYHFILHITGRSDFLTCHIILFAVYSTIHPYFL